MTTCRNSGRTPKWVVGFLLVCCKYAKIDPWNLPIAVWIIFSKAVVQILLKCNYLKMKTVCLLSHNEKTERRTKILKKYRALVYSKGLQLWRICIFLYDILSEISLRFKNHIHSEESALCIDMLPHNTISSSDLTTLTAFILYSHWTVWSCSPGRISYCRDFWVS